MIDRKNGLTYTDAGVDIDAGDAWSSTSSRWRAAPTGRAHGGLGGFGGLFDLKAAGFKDPILVSGTDGVGTKLKIAIETGMPDTVGIDLVAMCVNDIVVQGAEPLFFLDYFASGKLDAEAAAASSPASPKGAGERAAPWSAARPPKCPACTPTATTTSPASRSAPPNATRCCRARDIAPGDVVLGLASSGAHSNGYSLVRRIVEQPASATTRRAVRARHRSARCC